MNTKNNTGLNKLYPSAGNQTAIICQKGADMKDTIETQRHRQTNRSNFLKGKELTKE